jgi:hypothetical protein
MTPGEHAMLEDAQLKANSAWAAATAANNVAEQAVREIRAVAEAVARIEAAVVKPPSTDRLLTPNAADDAAPDCAEPSKHNA